MAIQVRAKDGTIQSFPDGTSPEAIRHAMLAYENKESWGDKLAGTVRNAVGQVTRAYDEGQRLQGEGLVRQAERRAALDEGVAAHGGHAGLGTMAYAGHNLPRNAEVRRQYVEAVRPLDSQDTARRGALKEAYRKPTPQPERALIYQERRGTGVPEGHRPNANKTNPAVDRAARIGGKLGRASTAASLLAGAYGVATADDKPREIVGQIGSIGGGVAGGIGGAELGGAAGLPMLGVGAFPAALAGGLAGSAIGGELGRDALLAVYDRLLGSLNRPSGTSGRRR